MQYCVILQQASEDDGLKCATSKFETWLSFKETHYNLKINPIVDDPIKRKLMGNLFSILGGLAIVCCFCTLISYGESFWQGQLLSRKKPLYSGFFLYKRGPLAIRPVSYFPKVLITLE